MSYVISRAANSTDYVLYDESNAKRDLDIIKAKVTIKGGADVIDKHLMTHQGIVTEVKDSDLEWLEKNTHFQEHVKNGTLIVVKRKKTPDAEEYARDLKRDKSSQLTPEDYKNRNAELCNGSLAHGALPQHVSRVA
jgi:hypothetical protein